METRIGARSNLRTRSVEIHRARTAAVADRPRITVGSADSARVVQIDRIELASFPVPQRIGLHAHIRPCGIFVDRDAAHGQKARTRRHYLLARLGIDLTQRIVTAADILHGTFLVISEDIITLRPLTRYGRLLAAPRLPRQAHMLVVAGEHHLHDDAEEARLARYRIDSAAQVVDTRIGVISRNQTLHLAVRPILVQHHAQAVVIHIHLLLRQFRQFPLLCRGTPRKRQPRHNNHNGHNRRTQATPPRHTARAACTAFAKVSHKYNI